MVAAVGPAFISARSRPIAGAIRRAVAHGRATGPNGTWRRLSGAATLGHPFSDWRFSRPVAA
jgi:hypothetical protein